MKKIVLISTGQPSVNPRLVKEADALSEAGFEVLVLYSFWTNWAFEKDKTLLAVKKWKAILVGGNPISSPFLYDLSRIFHKTAQLLAQKIGFGCQLAEFSKARTYVPLLMKAKSIRADLYIAHNLAALPIAVKAAKKHKSKCGFDAEDFHRQESSDEKTDFSYRIDAFLEDKYFPEINYLTAASPLIAENYKILYPFLKPITINNVFSIRLQPNFEPKNQNGLKLFWFSQTIGNNRGLEEIIEAIGILKNRDVSLTLLGNVSETDKNEFKNLALKQNLIENQLVFLHPIHPDEIFSLASKFDIGLALEQKTPLNRAICLTNKIFTYLIAGLAIVATDTQAQKRFLETHPNIGEFYQGGNANQLAEILEKYLQNKELLKNHQQNAYFLAKNELNWELEAEKFVDLVKSVLFDLV